MTWNKKKSSYCPAKTNGRRSWHTTALIRAKDWRQRGTICEFNKTSRRSSNQVPVENSATYIHIYINFRIRLYSSSVGSFRVHTWDIPWYSFDEMDTSNMEKVWAKEIHPVTTFWSYSTLVSCIRTTRRTTLNNPIRALCYIKSHPTMETIKRTVKKQQCFSFYVMACTFLFFFGLFRSPCRYVLQLVLAFFLQQ